VIINYLTIDLEDYFQVSAFEKVVGSHKNWDSYPSRIEANTKKILSLLDRHSISATFFIVGWIAERFPILVKDIDNCGHQIGCHSYFHRLVYDLTPEKFRNDTKAAKDILEQITGKKVLAYRAPSYSITRQSLWALEILEELGFSYDSSIFPIYHDLYGIPDAPRFEYKVPNQNLTEFPISTAKIMGHNIPISGGGYFRLFPYWFSNIFLKKINEQEKQPFVFYIHPWELDPDQPRIDGAKILARFRHNVNIGKTASRFEQLLQDFRFGPLGSNKDKM